MEAADIIQRLSEHPGQTYNFCMVAHVDHGKTTLSDYLVASNGVLSQQLAGEVRLLDSRPDEQERCITMKASSIALRHTHGGHDNLLNLVDSPGHIDFSCEVSTAIRLCDGAIVIVDVVDGVTQQTSSMLRNVYREGLSMFLVLNKVDLLITRQQLTPEEAYLRLRSIIETCNATLATYANQLTIQGEHLDNVHNDPSDDIWFCPTKGNVLFTSCQDGWGFGTRQFAAVYEKKLGLTGLQQQLWGEFYFDPKTKSVTTTPRREGQLPLAVQLMLEPIWQLYAAFLDEHEDTEKLIKMSEKLGVPQKEWCHPRWNQRSKLKHLLSYWQPLAKTALDTVCEQLDSALTAQRRRLPSLLPRFDETPADLKEALLSCSSSPDAPTVVYICKLIDTQYLVGTTFGQTVCDEDAFIGFARVYSGRISAGQEVYVYNEDAVSGESADGTATASIASKYTKATVNKVFLFRGNGLEEVSYVSSGALCGISGLTPHITKYATVSSRADMPPFKPLVLPSTSIVQLSVFPKDPSALRQLEHGIYMLNKVDPQVEVTVTPTGEHIIGAAGEVHSERCIKDLVDTFARVEIWASEPIVSFRETIVGGPNAKPKPFTAQTPDGGFTITLYARPLPAEAMEIIRDDNRNNGNNVAILRQVETVLRENRRWAGELQNGFLSTGPMRYGFFGSVLLANLDPDSADSLDGIQLLNQYKGSLISGFQAAVESGPMAMEPMFGIAFVITKITLSEGADTAVSSGLLYPCMRDACRAAMELHPRRLVEPVYECTIYSFGSTHGKIYSSLSRRRSEIVEEVPNEGSDLFYIRCLLPAVEAFGLQDELRISTHGASTAQLQMSQWDTIEADPYFTPTTREEIEEHGAEMGTKNIAEQLLEQIRRRKGLHRDLVVESAEKQKFSLKAA